MNLIPFGEVKEDRVKLSKDYKLIEMIGGIWRLTDKCKKHYDPSSYIYYLRGDIDKPRKITEQTPKPISKPISKPVVKPVKKMSVKEELRTPEVQQIIDEILNL